MPGWMSVSAATHSTRFTCMDVPPQIRRSSLAQRNIMSKQSSEIGYDIEELIESVQKYVPERCLVHAKSFLIGHQFVYAFEEVVEELISNNITIPRSLFESINNIGIYLEIKRDVWASLELKINNSQC